MDLLTLTRLAGLVGGLCWLARLLLFVGGHGSGAAASALFWLGALLLGVGLVGFGAAMVGPTWLRVVVGVAFPLLVWSVLQVLHDVADPRVIDGLVGIVLVGASAAALRHRRPDEPRAPRPPRPGERRRTRPTRGAHAR